MFMKTIRFYSHRGLDYARNIGMGWPCYNEDAEVKKKMDMHEIRTKRLLLRPFRESDYDDLFEFLS